MLDSAILGSDRSKTGKIRPLRASDLTLFRDHLLRLDAHSRRDRFNGVTDDEFVAAYAAKCFSAGTTIIGYVEDGFVRGAAEFHELAGQGGLSAEIAFSVEREWQGNGLGSLLFKRLIAHAKEIGCKSLCVTTHPQNEAMKALARKFHAKLSFQRGEAMGVIDLVDEAAAAAPVKPSPVWPRRYRVFKSRRSGREIAR